MDALFEHIETDTTLSHSEMIANARRAAANITGWPRWQVESSDWYAEDPAGELPYVAIIILRRRK